MRRPAELAPEMRARGHKMTPQRWAVLEVLVDGPDAHYTAEDVYECVRERMPTVSLRTIYETLHLLAEMGEIHALDVGTGSTHYDTDGRLHAHGVCPRCGRIDHVAVDLHDLATSLDAHRANGGWAEVVIHGLCDSCARPARSAASPGQRC